MCITETKPIKMPDDDQYTGSETEPQLTRQEDKFKKKNAEWASSRTQWSVTAVI